MDGKTLLPSRMRSGLLDGLDEPFDGSGLELFMSPEEIAGMDGLEKRGGGEQPAEDFGPRPLAAQDKNPADVAGDKFSGQALHSNGIVEGDNKWLPQNPFDKTGEGRG